MDPRLPELPETPSTLEPETEFTGIPESKIELEDLPAQVAARASEALPQRMVGLSFFVLALFIFLGIVAIILMLMSM